MDGLPAEHRSGIRRQTAAEMRICGGMSSVMVSHLSVFVLPTEGYVPFPERDRKAVMLQRMRSSCDMRDCVRTVRTRCRGISVVCSAVFSSEGLFRTARKRKKNTADTRFSD